MSVITMIPSPAHVARSAAVAPLGYGFVVTCEKSVRAAARNGWDTSAPPPGSTG